MKGLSSFGASGAAASLGGLPMAEGASKAPRRPQPLRVISEAAIKVRATSLVILVPSLMCMVGAWRRLCLHQPLFPIGDLLLYLRWRCAAKARAAAHGFIDAKH